jgi:PTS system nitrogen regulatory IIA component
MEDDRLLTLAELAAYLHMGQRTVLKLVEAKKVPGVLIDKEWRFRRTAIDRWLESQSQTEAQAAASGFEELPDGMLIPLGDLLPEAAIVHDMRASDPLGAIEELAARAYTNRWLNDKPWFVGAVVEREVLASTAMEGGVAFLHTRQREANKINRPFIIVGRSYDGIFFGAPDGRPTFLFFLLGLKHDRLHLPLLGRLARILARSPEVIGRLRAATSATKMRTVLLQLDSLEVAERRRLAEHGGAIGDSPLRPRMTSAKPALEREVRLRAIRRLSAQRQERVAATPGPRRGRPSAAGSRGAAKAKKTPAQPAKTGARGPKRSK